MDKKDKEQGKHDAGNSSAANRTDKVGSGRTIGRGMDSPDSTEAVLDASTGEPDPRARGEGALPPGQSSGQSTRTGDSNQQPGKGASQPKK